MKWPSFVILILVFVVIVVAIYPRRQMYVFAYGSLLDPNVLRMVFPDRSNTLYGKATLSGAKRVFMEYDDSVMLGVIPGESSDRVNGILIPVSDSDLFHLDLFEQPTHYRAAIFPYNESTEVFVYLPHQLTAPVIPSPDDEYMQSVEDGFSQYGPHYLEEFWQTTYPSILAS